MRIMMGSRSPACASVQHQFCQVFAKHYVFGARSQPQLIASHVEGKLQFGEIFMIENFNVHAAPCGSCSGLVLNLSPGGSRFGPERLATTIRWPTIRPEGEPWPCDQVVKLDDQVVKQMANQ